MREKHYRYMGVKPFEAADRSTFFGRDEDIEGLFNLILSEKLVVLFGKSGYGKSSLLNAGVLPLFQEAEEPERRAVVLEARLGAYTRGQTRAPIASVLAKLQEKLPESDLDPDDGLDLLFPNAAERPLWYHVKRRQTAGAGGRFVVVFDQFEEFFSYPRAEQEQFKRELAELLYSDVPQYLRKHLPQLPPEAKRRLAQPMQVKAVFAIRADRMSLLDSMTDILPAILHKRYELRSLSTAQARDAIVKPAGLSQNIAEQAGATITSKLKTQNSNLFATPPFEYTDAALQKILTELSANHSKGIEAFQLQILCQYVESRIENGEIPDRDRNGLPDVDTSDLPDMKNLYETYYRRQLDRLNPERQRSARIVLEEGLLAEDPQSGEGRRMSVDSQFLKSQFEVDDELLRALENTYLVRKEPNSVGGESLELSHDTLVAPVLKMKKERRGREELEEAKRREAEAQRREEKERSRRRRANVLSGVAVLMAVLAAGLGLWAMNERKVAEQSRNAAVLEKNKTQKALDDFRKIEAEKVLVEVNDWLIRAESLRSKGYAEHAAAMRDSVVVTLKNYPENPTLRQKLQELK